MCRRVTDVPAVIQFICPHGKVSLSKTLCPKLLPKAEPALYMRGTLKCFVLIRAKSAVQIFIGWIPISTLTDSITLSVPGKYVRAKNCPTAISPGV